jgi:hypothetical protein
MLGKTNRSIGLVDLFAVLKSADFRNPLNYEDLNDPVSGATTQLAVLQQA